MALSTTANYSLRKHDAGDLNWDVDVNWNMTEIDKKLKLLFANFLTCSTAVGTAAKVVSFANFVLEAGCLIAVKFTNGNSASGATLNVNSTGAKAIQVNGAAVAAGAIAPNGVYLLAYDGTNWAMLTREMVFDASETVKGVVELATSAEVLAGTDTERGITPATLTAKILGTVSEASGVPTGAIIESGSNANGRYVKFADGTMLCTGTGVWVSEAVKNKTIAITAPATFNGSPKVVVISKTILGDVVVVGAVSLNQFALYSRLGVNFSAGIEFYYDIVWFGRWY